MAIRLRICLLASPNQPNKIRKFRFVCLFVCFSIFSKTHKFIRLTYVSCLYFPKQTAKSELGPSYEWNNLNQLCYRYLRGGTRVAFGPIKASALTPLQ